MTLKDKFEEIEDLGRFSDSGYSTWSTKVLDRQSNECVKIADEFAIEFAKWIRKETYYEHLTKEFIYKRNVYASEKELLQIYKQEKGL